jgi:DNA invertase Pin-like site-specific DNA recombinase
MAVFGYARVSTAAAKSRKAQHVDNQVQRLLAEGIRQDCIFTDDGSSGKLASRPEWDRCLSVLRDGDTLVITKLDRVGRSLMNLVDVVRLLGDRGVQIRCLDQGEIDTTTPNGKLIFHIMSALAEWEASMARERTLEGLAAARVRYGGTLPVRKPSMSPDKVALGRELLERRDMTAGRVAEMLGVSRATLYRNVARLP